MREPSNLFFRQPPVDGLNFIMDALSLQLGNIASISYRKPLRYISTYTGTNGSGSVDYTAFNFAILDLANANGRVLYPLVRGTFTFYCVVGATINRVNVTITNLSIGIEDGTKLQQCITVFVYE